MEYFAKYEHNCSDVCHYGRLGMKWHQHVYGTNKLSSSQHSKKNKITKQNNSRENASQRAKLARKLEYKNVKKNGVSYMSDQELSNKIARLQKEKMYKDLLREDVRYSKSEGSKIVENALSQSATKILVSSLVFAAGVAINGTTGKNVIK